MVNEIILQYFCKTFETIYIGIAYNITTLYSRKIRKIALKRALCNYKKRRKRAFPPFFFYLICFRMKQTLKRNAINEERSAGDFGTGIKKYS